MTHLLAFAAGVLIGWALHTIVDDARTPAGPPPQPSLDGNGSWGDLLPVQGNRVLRRGR